MKIHVFIAHMGLGGAERVCVNLANEWARNGHEVHIVVLNLDNDINTQYLTDDVRVHTLGVSRLRYAMLPMYKYVRRNEPEFMLVFGNEMAIIMQKLKSMHLIDTPMYVRVLNNVNISLSKEDGISPAVEKYLKNAQKELKKMDGIVAQCEAMGRQLTDRGLVNADRLHVIYNPVSKELCEKVRALRVAAGSGERKEIVFIGRIDPQKNPLDLLEAFAKISGKYTDGRMENGNPDIMESAGSKVTEDAVLRFVGDGVLTDAVRDRAAKLGIADKVIFDGIRTDMENVYASASVIALSSDYEGMPNCLIEAIGCGIPVVSYDCPMGPAEIVVDGVNGYLIPVGDKDALADGLIKTLDRTWNAEEIIATCDKFDVKNLAEKYEELFGGRTEA